MTIELNKKTTKKFIVKDNDSAKQMGSGDLLVLATPALVAFMEEVAKDYLNSIIDKELGSVGSNINIDHLAPTLIGKEVIIEAEVTEVIKEKIIKFAISAYELTNSTEHKLIAKAEHTRVIINNKKFMSKLLGSNDV